MPQDLGRLTDDELIESLKRLIRDERSRLVSILRHLDEMDRRRLAGKKGFPSLFDYCVKELRLAEGETARRIHVARAAKKHPRLYRVIDRGLLSLSAAALLAPHLTWENHRRLIRSAVGLKTRDVEALVASLSPSPDRPDRVKFLGSPAAAPPLAPSAVESAPAAAPAAVDARPPEIPPYFRQPQRVFFSFTADERLLAAVERAKELLQNKYGRPEFEHVFFEAIGALLEKIDPEARAARARPRAASASAPGEPRRRSAPSWVKRAVWKRDGGRCAFRGDEGRRCDSKAGLHFDHIVPWALGGRSDDPANIRLLCRTHNALEARRSFGDSAVDAAIARRRDMSSP